MTIGKLASAIAKKEGKKSQARVGDIREILKIIVDLEVLARLSSHPPDDFIKNSPIASLISRVDVVLHK